MTERERLFLDTIADLEAKASLADRYALIKASGLLRLLLIDGSALVHQVSRAHRVPLRFETVDYTLKPPFPESILFHWISLDASGSPDAKRRTSTLGEFLGVECLASEGRYFTVRNVILAAALLKGGVHAGKPRTDDERAPLDLDQVLNVGGFDASVATLRGIIAVTLVALRPIVDAVKKAA
jgi:hypothetical protein